MVPSRLHSANSHGCIKFWKPRRAIGRCHCVVDDFLASASDPGDFDGNGSLDSADVDALIAAASDNTAFDLTGDGAVDQADLFFWVKELKNTWNGDSNLDGEFNSSDFVTAFASAKFEQDIDASWSDGDWTGDGRFDSSDFVAAFTDGGFELGPRSAVASVPEPNIQVASASVLILLLGAARRQKV